MSKARVIILLFVIGFTIYSGISLIGSVGGFFNAEKNLGYEYGRCVFYEEMTVEQCNGWTDNKGLAAYEKYYGDGSWTVEGDPDPTT
jgi:hypothetical protein